MKDWVFLTEKEIINEIGIRLKKIRLQSNLTQNALSEDVGTANSCN